MRRVIVSEMVTADGFFAGSRGELDWHLVDAEFNEYAIDLLNAADTLLFGRVTYQLMAAYWPTPAAIKNDPVVAERMNNLSKLVFSKTLDKVPWNCSTLTAQVAAEEIMR